MCVPALCVVRRLWFKRPLAPEALQYAADDVRYLLPVAHSLLQTLPGALMQLSNINILLGQPKASGALQLHSALLPGYGPLLKRSQQGAGNGNYSSAAAAAAAAAVSGQELSGMTGICFELQLDGSVPGWLIPSYQVYMNEQLQQEEGSRALPEAGVAAGSCGSSSAAPSSSAATPAAGALQADAPAVGGSAACEQQYSGGDNAAAQVDEAVESMMQLLPEG